MKLVVTTNWVLSYTSKCMIKWKNLFSRETIRLLANFTLTDLRAESVLVRNFKPVLFHESEKKKTSRSHRHVHG